MTLGVGATERDPSSSLPVVVRVIGSPAPKGSARAILRGGRAVLVSTANNGNRDRISDWKSAVGTAWNGFPCFRKGPLCVGLVFRLPTRVADLTPLGYPKPVAPRLSSVKPDCDKLLRATLDALTAAGAWGDDAQVAVVHLGKVYIPPGSSVGATLIVGDWESDSVYGLWRAEMAICRDDMATTAAIGAQAATDARARKQRVRQ